MSLTFVHSTYLVIKVTTYQHKVQHEEGTDDDEWDEEYPIVDASYGVVGL